MTTPNENARRLSLRGEGDDGRSACWRWLGSSRRSAWLIAAPLALATAIAEPADVYRRAPVQPPLGSAVPDTAPARVYSATLSSPQASIANTIAELNGGATPAVLGVVFDPEGARRLPKLIDPSTYQPPGQPVPVESCDQVPVQLWAVVTLGAGSPYSTNAMPSYFLYATVGNQTVDGGSQTFADPGVAQRVKMREPVLLGPGPHTVNFRLQWNLPSQGLPLPEVGLRSQFEIRCRQEAPARQLQSAVNPTGVFVGTTQINSGSGNVPSPGVSSAAVSAAPARAGTAPNWGAVPGGLPAAAAAAAPGSTPPADVVQAQRGAGRLTFTAAQLGTIDCEQVDLEPAQGRLRAMRRSERELALLQQMAASGAVEPVVRVAFADGEYELSQVLIGAVRPSPGSGTRSSRYSIDLKFSGIRRLR